MGRLARRFVVSMTTEPDFEKAMQALCSLLDAVDLALTEKDYNRAVDLVDGRFALLTGLGFEVVFHEGPASGERH